MYDDLGNQRERLLAYMRERGPITQKDAMLLLGIYRLGARILELKKAGYDITSEWITTTNRFGEECRVKVYALRESA